MQRPAASPARHGRLALVVRPLLALLALTGPPQAAHALLPNEVATHTKLLRQQCVRPKDFCVIKSGGTYHAYSIKVDTTVPDALTEHMFLHQKSTGNLQAWSIQPDDSLWIPPRTGWDKDRIWAPHIVQRNGVYHMFYTGVRDSTPQMQRVGVRTATVLNTAYPSPWNPNGTDPTLPIYSCPGTAFDCGKGELRDPFVMANPNASNWMMLYVAKRTNDTMGIGVALSAPDSHPDPLTEPFTYDHELVAASAQYGPNAAKIESPHFFQHGSTRYVAYTGKCDSPTCTSLDLDGDEVRVMTTTDPTLNPASWVYRGALSTVTGKNLSLLFAPEYVRDPDTGEEFFAAVRPSEQNTTACRPNASTDSSTVDFYRIVWDVDPVNNPWKFRLVDPNPPGAWSNVSTFGPSARDQAATALDAGGHRLYAFGGQDATSLRNDVWAYSLGNAPTWGNWTPSSGAMPVARRHASVIYDPVGNRLVVFGGFSSSSILSTLTDTWTFGSLSSAFPTWAQVTASGAPSGLQSGTEAVYDPVRARMIVVDGIGRAWALSLPSGGTPAWSVLNGSGGLGNAGGYYFNLAYDSKRDRLLAFGGWLPSNAPYSFNAVYGMPLSGAGANSWSLVTTTGAAPSGRALAAAFYDPGRDRLVVQGGQNPATGNGSTTGDSWQLALGTLANTGTWTQLSSASTGPAARSGHTAIYDAVEDRAVLFGGLLTNGTRVGDAWSQDFGEGAPYRVTDFSWTVHCTSLSFSWTSPRDGKSNASDEPGDSLVAPVFGPATSYSIVRSANPITQANWGSASVVTTGPLPAPGTLVEVDGVGGCTTRYYYAVATVDEAGHWSCISNTTARTSCPGPVNCEEAFARPATEVGLVPTTSLKVLGSGASGVVTIQYSLGAETTGRDFSLDLFDVAGRRLRTLASGPSAPGLRAVTLGLPETGRGAGTGVLFVRFRVGETSITRSIVARW